MKRVMLYLWLAALLAGCAGGEGYQLLGYDAIDAAAVESAKGVRAYDTAVRLATTKNHAEYLTKLKRDVKRYALAKGETEASAEIAATLVAAGAESHFANLAEQERRRAEWFNVTIDNLQYIREVCEDAKAFAIYRSSIEAQWKHYLQSQARASLARMGAENVPATTRPK